MKKGEEYEEGGTEGSKGEQRGVKGELVGGDGQHAKKETETGTTHCRHERVACRAVRRWH